VISRILKYKKWIIISAIAVVIFIVIRKLKFRKMIKDIIDQLPRKGEYTQRSLSDIDRIIIHHSASPAGKFTVWDFARWHIDPNGRLKAPGIAYHFGIEPDGTIYQVNKLTAKSWHTINGNQNGIGIELNGNFENEQPTEAQKTSLKWLIRYLKKLLKKNLAVYGHKEIPGNSTACPGRNLNIDEFRNLA